MYFGGRADADESTRAARVDPAQAETVEKTLPVVEVERAIRATTQQVEAGEPNIKIRFGDTADWVHTTTGEWIRGDVDWMRNDIMEFDSEEFGPLELHMRDVAEVHAPQVSTYVFDDRTSLVGRGLVTNDRVIVETEEGVQGRPRDTLWAIVEGGARELDYWSTRLNLGLSANRGNSDQVEFNLGWSLTREDRRTLTELDYGLNLGRADGEQNVSRHIVLFVNQVWVSERFFVQPVTGQLLSDKFQDTTFRAQPAVGAGVRFLDTPRAWWHISTGIGYQYLKLFEPFPGVPDPQHDGLVRFATRARFDITGDVYLLINWVTNLTFTTIGNTNHTGIAAFLLEVTNIFDFEASFLYLRTEEPPPRANGTFPAKNDYRLVLGVTLQLG